MDSLPKGIGDAYISTRALCERVYASDMDSLPKGIGDAIALAPTVSGYGKSDMDSLPKGIGDHL